MSSFSAKCFAKSLVRPFQRPPPLLLHAQPDSAVLPLVWYWGCSPAAVQNYRLNPIPRNQLKGHGEGSFQTARRNVRRNRDTKGYAFEVRKAAHGTLIPAAAGISESCELRHHRVSLLGRCCVHFVGRPVLLKKFSLPRLYRSCCLCRCKRRRVACGRVPRLESADGAVGACGGNESAPGSLRAKRQPRAVGVLTRITTRS